MQTQDRGVNGCSVTPGHVWLADWQGRPGHSAQSHAWQQCFFSFLLIHTHTNITDAETSRKYVQESGKLSCQSKECCQAQSSQAPPRNGQLFCPCMRQSWICNNYYLTQGASFIGADRCCYPGCLEPAFFAITGGLSVQPLCVRFRGRTQIWLLQINHFARLQ